MGNCCDLRLLCVVGACILSFFFRDLPRSILEQQHAVQAQHPPAPTNAHRVTTHMDEAETKAGIITAEDRAVGAIVGLFIGDALGLGCHWFYDLEEMRREFGWVTDYIEPRKNRYHYGCKAGDVSQTGQVAEILLQSVVENEEYNETDFCRRWDKLLSTLDGTRWSGRYTAKDMCDVWKNRHQGKPWGEAGSDSGDTTDGCVRSVIVAARYASDYSTVARLSRANAKLHYKDKQVQTVSMSFGVVIAALIRGLPLDISLMPTLRELLQSGKLPYSFAVLAEDKAKGVSTNANRDGEEDLSDPDSLFLPAMIAKVAKDPSMIIEPSFKVAQLYGPACAFYMVLPAAYFLAAKFSDDFETAVLHAVNGGGQNLARASLTGALVGAMTGIQGIPQRWIDGLQNGPQIVKWARTVARLGTQGL